MMYFHCHAFVMLCHFLASQNSESGSVDSKGGATAEDLVSKLQKLYLREITIGETYFGSGFAPFGFGAVGKL